MFCCDADDDEDAGVETDLDREESGEMEGVGKTVWS